MILDINALIGEWPFAELPHRTAEGLLALMDRHSIDRAAVATSVEPGAVFRTTEKLVPDLNDPGVETRFFRPIAASRELREGETIFRNCGLVWSSP